MDFIIYCLLSDILQNKKNSIGLSKDSKYCVLSVHFEIFSYFFQKIVLHKTIVSQFDEVIFYAHEDHDLKI